MKKLPPLDLSEEARGMIRELLRDSLVAQYSEHWVALHEMESPEDIREAEARIFAIQGPSPKDRAWPLQPWNPEPPHEPGWDSGNRLKFKAAKEVYDEYVAKGKIKLQNAEQSVSPRRCASGSTSTPHHFKSCLPQK